MSSIVYVVHCVDAEGPLKETYQATFERIKEIWGITIEPTKENLKRIQNKEIELDGHENTIAELAHPKLLNYNDNWDKLNTMLADITSNEYRNRFKDSFGNGWIWSWFCLDHVGYINNPRQRDIGYHKVFDRYMELQKSTKNNSDGINFHYHPVSISRSANHCATSYFGHSDTLYQILSRKIIDRSWFPSVFRPGFSALRPDSHWFLEQYIPFDFGNHACEIDLKPHPDLHNGRFGDWRRAPRHWTPYHPAHEDYQLEGNCKRLIMRCLNVRTRLYFLKQSDVDQAFVEAKDGKVVVLSFSYHDLRDMRPDIDHVCKMLLSSKKRFPEIKFKYCEAKSAVRQAMHINSDPAIKLNLLLEDNRLRVRSSQPTFGPQPFLAIKTKGGDYYHDNFDFQIPYREWTYTFDIQTLPLEKVSAIGVASCDNSGNTSVIVKKL